MTKVRAIVIYHSATLYNVTVSNDTIGFTILFKDREGKFFTNFHSMYDAVLNLILENNFFLNFTEKFKLKFFDIAWIDVIYPYTVEEFGF